MQTIAARSLEAYRRLAHDNPLFFDFFRALRREAGSDVSAAAGFDLPSALEPAFDNAVSIVSRLCTAVLLV